MSVVPLADLAATYARLQAANADLNQRLLRDPTTLAAGLDRHYQVRAHLRLIGDEFITVAAQPDARLLIMTPPQVGKTTTAAEWAVFWWLAKHPRHRVVVASYGSDLALKRGKRIRALIEEHGAAFGLRLAFGSSSVNDWSLDSGGGVRCVGVGSGLTGHPADLFVIDDPHKDRAEAESLRIRDACHDWYSSTVLTRFQPGTRLIMILTRWHEDDLAGRVLKDEGDAADSKDGTGLWRVVHIPAIADPELTKHGDPLGRTAGQPLTHPKIPEHDLPAALRYWENRRRLTVIRDWHALYQGDPKPTEGALISREVLRELRQLRDIAAPVRKAVAVDPSGEGRDTAGVVAGHLGQDGRLWVTHDRSGVMTTDQWARSVCELAYEISADLILYEHNFGAGLVRRSIRVAWEALQRQGSIPADERSLCPRIEAVKAKTGKRVRAEPIAQAMTEDLVRLAAYMPELEQEWATWMPTDALSPGRLDASVYLAYKLLPIPGAKTHISSAAQVDRAQVANASGWAATLVNRPGPGGRVPSVR